MVLLVDTYTDFQELEGLSPGTAEYYEQIVRDVVRLTQWTGLFEAYLGAYLGGSWQLQPEVGDEVYFRRVENAEPGVALAGDVGSLAINDKVQIGYPPGRRTLHIFQGGALP